MSCADRPRKEIDWDKKLKSKEWRQKVESKEWGAWKFVSDMLDNPNEYGIYPTSECYEKIHDFVEQAKTEAKIEVLEEVREAFHETFYGAGELWFNYIFKDGDIRAEEDARDFIEQLWQETLDNLNLKKKKK